MAATVQAMIDNPIGLLSHRPPFLFVDAVDELIPGVRCVARWKISGDEPWLGGHFPGNPIIPGALLLADVLRSIGQATRQHFVSCQVRSAKFQHPVRPGDSVEIEYAISAQGIIDFKCAVAGIRVLSGVISATAVA